MSISITEVLISKHRSVSFCCIALLLSLFCLVRLPSPFLVHSVCLSISLLLCFQLIYHAIMQLCNLSDCLTCFCFSFEFFFLIAMCICAFLTNNNNKQTYNLASSSHLLCSALPLYPVPCSFPATPHLSSFPFPSFSLYVTCL